MSQPTFSPAAPDAAYGFYCRPGGLDFAAALARVTEALKAEGFGVATGLRARLERVRAALSAAAGR